MVKQQCVSVSQTSDNTPRTEHQARHKHLNIDKYVDSEYITFTALLLFNPLKCSGVRWLHFEVFSAIQDEPITGYTLPSRSNLHFQFLTFGHSGAQD